MRGHECPATVFAGKLSRIVEDNAQRRRVRVQKNVRYQNLVFKLGVFPLVARVLIAPQVEPWPTVEAAVNNVGDVVRWKIVTQLVAFIHRDPKFACHRISRQPGRITNPPCVDSFPRSIWIELQNVRAPLFVCIIADVGMGTDSDVKLLTVLGEREVTRPMSAAKTTPAGQIGNNCFYGSASFQITVLIGKPHHGIRVADINILRSRSRGVESNSIRHRETRREYVVRFDLSLFAQSAKHANSAGRTFREEEIPIGSRDDLSSVFQASGNLFDFEPRRRLRPRTLGTMHDFRPGSRSTSWRMAWVDQP